MSRAEIIRNAAALARLGLTPDECVQIMGASRALRRIGERQCNGYHDPAAEKRDDRREASLLRKAQAIAEAHGLKVYHQGDPRGCALYLYRPEDLVSYSIRTGARFTSAATAPASISSCYSSVGVPVYA